MTKGITAMLGRAGFRIHGWTYDPFPDFPEKKHVIIGFPHRSMTDTILTISYFLHAGIKGRILIKKEMFFWPLAPLLTALGGIPVDRGAKSGVVEQMAEEFGKREVFHLAMVPEGTRKKVARLKTGFWHIAGKADVSILCWYIDNRSKRFRFLGRILPGNSLSEDMDKIRLLYREAGYEIPAAD